MENKLKQYVDKFNSNDEEIIKQHIENAKAYEWLEENIPLLECPDHEVEETYYFRWWVYRKHIKDTPEGFIITEFLPDVYWAGKYNSINCAVGHHLYEGRWLKNSSIYLEDDIRFWIKGSGDIRSYSTWIADAVYQYCLVQGNFDIALDLLPEMKDNFRQWEKEHQHESGLFWSIDDRDAMEYSISGNGLRPTLNSYMYADAMAIGKLAQLKGDNGAAEYFDKAKQIKQLVQKRLWDDKSGFFKVMPLDSIDDKLSDGGFENVPQERNVREEIGFIPWYFNMPDEGYEKAWEQLIRPDGFAAPYGPTTAEQRHPRYDYEQSDHECLWNGPSWPYATSQTLTAMSNVLKNYTQDYVTKDDFYHIFLAYTHSHYRINENGEWVNWLDENLDPYSGEWISRKILKGWGWKSEKGGYERGKDYNHSTYADIVINGIFGVEPLENGKVRINPMLPRQWAYCRLQKVMCRKKEISIIYDATGEKFDSGKGFQVWCDGKLVHHSNEPEMVII